MPLFKDFYELKEELGKYVQLMVVAVASPAVLPLGVELYHANRLPLLELPWSLLIVCPVYTAVPFSTCTAFVCILQGCIQCGQEVCVYNESPAVCCQDHQQEETHR